MRILPCFEQKGAGENKGGPVLFYEALGWLESRSGGGYDERDPDSERNLLCIGRFANSLLIWKQQASRIGEQGEAIETLLIRKLRDQLQSQGNAGDDAKKYQERAVIKAIEESKS